MRNYQSEGEVLTVVNLNREGTQRARLAGQPYLLTNLLKGVCQTDAIPGEEFNLVVMPTPVVQVDVLTDATGGFPGDFVYIHADDSLEVFYGNNYPSEPTTVMVGALLDRVEGAGTHSVRVALR